MSQKSATEVLVNSGVRPSHQRIAIMEYLLSVRNHPTADEVFTALSPSMPTLSKATVYNTLNLLSSTGAIKVLTIDPVEKRFDGFTHAHAHMFCVECRNLLDIDLDQEHIDLIDSCAKEHSVLSRELYMTGICKHCAVKNNN